MVLSDDDQLNKNALLFIYLRENKPIQDKVANIENILKDGADVNAKDRNNNDNTPLHIATEKTETDVVQLLLDNGALLFHNGKGKTPVDIAKGIDSTIGMEIAAMLEENGKYPARPSNQAVQQKQKQDPPKNRQNNNKGNKQKKNDHYLKREGTSGVSGQFYETKLLSLVLLRSLDDTDIEHFLLATNIKDIGDFDDVCFRYKLKHQDKHVMIFLQAKHKDDPDKWKLTVMNVQSATGDFGLAKYFDSFLKIRNKFSPDNPDPMFKGDFHDVECYFILYTSLKENFSVADKCEIHPMCAKMHRIIYTGDNEGAFQFNYGTRDVDYLTYFILEERVKNMGLVFLDFILSSKERHDSMMTNNLIKTFHPALAQKVLSVSEIKPENYRLGRFKQDFFESEEDILITLKETLCKAIVIKYCKKTTLSKEEIQSRINEILNKPCAQTISSLIGDVLIFDDKNVKLNLNESYIPKQLLNKEDVVRIKNDLQKIVLVPAIINDAIVLAGRPKLESLSFKLPATFGNSDLSIRGTEKKVASRINFLATKFVALIDKYKDTKIIEIGNATVGPEKILEFLTLETNGGIGGAVGNLLNLDNNSDMLVFNTDENTLPEKARSLLINLKSQTNEDLSTYKIKVNIEVFPKMNFHANHYDKSLGQEFLNKLWFYTGQAKEDGVEQILKNEINSHCNADKSQDQFFFNVHSDAIFLRFHDEIQKWWKTPTKAQYLTKNDKLFDDAKKDIIDRPLLTVLNVMCVRQIKKIGLEFKPDTAKTFELDKFTEGLLNVVSDAVILSTAKIMQFAQDPNNYIFINLDYVLQLPFNDYKTMIDELRHEDDEDTKASTLVIINQLPKEGAEWRGKLESIISDFSGNKIIIVTEKDLNIESKKRCSKLNYTINDECVNLTDLTPASQSKCLNEYKIIYQGQEVDLSTVIDDTSKHLVSGNVLRKLLNNEKVEIGHTLNSPKYDQIKEYYMKRHLIYDDEELQVNTFNDISNNPVVIAGKPCMGKTTLLTHLSLETKKVDPRSWIVRMNLSQSKEFERWQDKTIKINDAVKFLCKTALKKADEINKVNMHSFDDHTVFVSSKEDGAEVSFELQLFIHYFNNNQTILLFDGFDRIYSHSARECIELFKTLNRINKRMWITTSSYFSKLLEREFGPPYQLERILKPQQQSFLHSFWKTNLKLEKLNHDQFNNIILFLKFVFNSLNLKHKINEEDRAVVTLISMPLHILYVAAVEHFKSEFSLSPKHFREKLKQKFNLDSLTSVDKYLRESDEDEQLELAGTPLHMYIAANYFNVQIKDKLDLGFNTDMIRNKLGVYTNTLTVYERFIKSNMNEICKLKYKSMSPKALEKEQDKLRNDFIEKHKKLALYAICKESDVYKLLTPKEISEVQATIKRIESGEEESELIDCVIDGIPRFHNFLFAEYFLVEFATNLLRACHANDIQQIRIESMLDCVVNLLLLASPPGVRNAFEYKLKYDPELMEAASDKKCQKTIFNLLLKEQMRGNASDYNAETVLDTAVNEGFVNISKLLILCVQENVTDENIDVFTRLLKGGVLMLSVVEPTWRETADKALESLPIIRDVAKSLDAEQIEGISRAVVTLCSNTELGKKVSDTVKTRLCEPIKQLTEKAVDKANNENLTAVVEQLSYHLPEFINTLFGNTK